MENRVDFRVWGRRALFTDPLTKIGGEKFSYQIPTYQALKGIVESVYWKPTLIWRIDRVRILHSIQIEPQNVRPINYSGGNTLAIYSYLQDVSYQVQAHFEWNLNRPDLINDRNEHKHYWVAKRMLKRGGRRDIFLGSRECQGYVEPCSFGEGSGAYDQTSDLAFGLMFHGFDYPDESGADELWARFFYPVMKRGIVEFTPPKQCTIRKLVRPMQAAAPKSSGLNEPGLLQGYEEGRR